MRPHFQESSSYIVECSCGHRSFGRDRHEAEQRHASHVRAEADYERRRAEQKRR